jgi:hypothetical protein
MGAVRSSCDQGPTSTAQTIARFEQATAQGRIQLIGAATADEVRSGLIDNRVLGVLLAFSGRHRLQVNSLRVSHPRGVQDDLGTPTDSNHAFGRAADISAVDGVLCSRETRRAPYRTIHDNPPPPRPGPCLALADEASQLDGELAVGEIIFYWRVPGPPGVSMPNHDDHVHLGYRNYPRVTTERPGRPPNAAAAGQTDANRQSSAIPVAVHASAQWRIHGRRPQGPKAGALSHTDGPAETLTSPPCSAASFTTSAGRRSIDR